MAPVVTRGARMVPALLRERRDFRRYWTGHTISLFGDAITLIALPLVAVLVLDAGAAQMGYLAAAGLVPSLLFSVHAGAWVDRRARRRRIMIVADLGRAGLLATVPLAYALGALTLGQLYVVAFLVGTLSVLFTVSDTTLFVALTPRDRYVEGNAVLNGSRALSFVGGPSLGGLLVQFLSAPGALLADAASFVASALFLGRISPAEQPPDADPRGNVRAGARWILGSPCRPRVAAVRSHDQLLQPGVPPPVRPLRHAHARDLAGDARRHPRLGRRGRRARVPAGRAPGQAARHRAGVHPGVPAVHRPARARAARGRLTAAGARAAGRRAVRLGPRRDGPRHLHRRDLRRHDPRPPAGPCHRRLPRRQLWCAPAGLGLRRRARQRHRPASDPVDRDGRRGHRRSLAAPRAGLAAQDPARRGTVTPATGPPSGPPPS